MSGPHNPVPLNEAIEEVTGPKGVTSSLTLDKIEPADITHMNMNNTMQPTTPSEESAFLSLADPEASLHVHDVHSAQAITPVMPAEAPEESTPIINDLGNSLEHTTNDMAQIQIPDVTLPPITFPKTHPDGGFNFNPQDLIKEMQQATDRSMAQQASLANGLFEANMRLQNDTIAETMISQSATQVGKSFKQLLNGQGG